MIRTCPRNVEYSREIRVDGVSMKFSGAPDYITVSIQISHTLLESYESSWGTMVIFRTARTSAVKETYLLTSSRFLQGRALPQGSTMYLVRTRTITALFGST